MFLGFGDRPDHKHVDTCQYCELIPEVARCLEGTLNQIEESELLTPQKINVMRFEVQDSLKKIFDLMSHTIRDQVQQNGWEKMIEQMMPHQSFLTVSMTTLLEHSEAYPTEYTLCSVNEGAARYRTEIC